MGDEGEFDLDTADLIFLMIHRGYVIAHEDGSFDLGDPPPADEKPVVKQFYLTLEAAALTRSDNEA